MTFILCFKIQKTIKLLYKKLYYALTLVPEFSDGLVFKIKAIRKMRVIIIIYPIIFLLSVVVHKTLAYQYDSTCLEFFNYYILDLFILLINLLWIFRPQPLPNNFNVDFARDIEGDSGVIYKFKLPQLNHINFINQVTETKMGNSKGNTNKDDEEIIFKPISKKDAVYCQKKKMPILIFNPRSLNSNSSSGSSSFAINNSIDDGEINKYFAALEIGFSEEKG